MALRPFWDMLRIDVQAGMKLVKLAKSVEQWRTIKYAFLAGRVQPYQTNEYLQKINNIQREQITRLREFVFEVHEINNRSTRRVSKEDAEKLKNITTDVLNRVYNVKKPA